MVVCAHPLGDTHLLLALINFLRLGQLRRGYQRKGSLRRLPVDEYRPVEQLAQLSLRDLRRGREALGFVEQLARLQQDLRHIGVAGGELRLSFDAGGEGAGEQARAEHDGEDGGIGGVIHREGVERFDKEEVEGRDARKGERDAVDMPVRPDGGKEHCEHIKGDRVDVLEARAEEGEG